MSSLRSFFDNFFEKIILKQNTMRATIDQIKPVAAQIKTGWDLCDFAGKSESEAIIVQVLKGSASNSAGAYTIKKLKRSTRLFDNEGGYKLCLRRGWLEEEKVDNETRIYPTEKLVKAVEAHLAK